ncbi:MAG: hypothetical protein VKK04_06345 [Synechococcales bacterium]|nr:hypothetical protein [Synechococcales bacterium]
MTWQDDQLIACSLDSQVNLERYQHIKTEGLFNLKPEICNSLSSDTFLPETDITIEATLKPDLLPLLAEQVTAIDQIAAYLLHLNQTQPDSPLFSTENWLACSVKQQQPTGEVGYRTLWSYISPAALAQPDASSSDEISEGLINFFKDWAEINLTATTQTAAAQALEGITGFLEQFADLDFDQLLDQTFDRFLDPAAEDSSAIARKLG